MSVLHQHRPLSGYLQQSSSKAALSSTASRSACTLHGAVVACAAFVTKLACIMADHSSCGPTNVRQTCCNHSATLQACFVDFGMAAQNGGRCILRFDDTNPDAEKQEFIDHIQDIIAWLGWTPAQART
jgi:tRNA synthetases class I (E and Q), catalytic domain